MAQPGGILSRKPSVGFSVKESRSESVHSSTDAQDDSSDEDEDILKKLPKRLRAVDSNAIPRHHETRDIGTLAVLSLLVCKCMKMIWRHKILVSLELACPIIGVVILAIYTTTLDLDNDPKPIIYTPFGYDPVNLKMCSVIHVVGNGPFAEDIVTELRADPQDIFHIAYSYRTQIDFESRLHDGSLCAAVIFKNLPNDKSAGLPLEIEYELRLPAVPKFRLPHPITGVSRPLPVVSTWETNRVYPSGIKVGPRNRYDNTGGVPGYYTEGFLFLQHKVDCILLRLIYQRLPANGRLPRDVCNDLHVFPHFQRFPYPPYQHVNLQAIVAKWLPFVLVLSYIMLFAVNTWLLVREKEIGMKGFLEYFNVTPWKQWLSWILYRTALHAIALIPVVFILTGSLAYDRAVINKSSTLALYCFLLTYVLNCICTSCLFSTFFYKAKSACAIAIAIWLLSYLPSLHIDYDIAPNHPRPNDQHFSIFAATVYCFFANSGLSYGLQVISHSEINSKGISMDTLLTERFDLGHVMICMVAMSLISILLSTYIERISPTSNAHEEALPLLYFIYRPWWKGEQIVPKEKRKSITSSTAKPMELTHPQFFERNPKKSDRAVEISLTNATCERSGAIGISQINLRCVSGEIVAILGSPKSGKTVLWNVCAGLMALTSGGVFLKKRHMVSFMGYARANIGICPQVNALYDYLTVEEHFSLFVQLKGVIIAADAYEEIENLIIGLDLDDVRKVHVKDLSPGQKRFVHIGIAFASGSKIILLDEPTEGMDVPMKRTAWRFFDSERTVRTIILFTKDTEEASYVGDRVVVLINGEVYVRGTPTFIKTMFDGGYHLELTKMPNLNKKELLTMTREMMPRAKLLYSGYQEIRLLLPDEYTPFFPVYFEKLQTKKEAFGIKDMSISFVPFEEILKKITKLSVKDPNFHKKLYSTHWRKVALLSKIIMPLRTKRDVLESNQEGCFVNIFRQLFLMLLSNVRFTLRRWKWLLAPSALIFIFVFLGPFLMEKTGFSKLEEIGPVELNFKNFQNPRVLFKCEDNHKVHADFCLSVQRALADMGLRIDNATSEGMDRQLLSHYIQGVTAQDLNYDMAVDVKFRHFENDVIVYFDNQPLHVLPTASTFFTKLLYLRMRASALPPVPPEAPEHKISVINRPLPYTVPQRLRIARSFLGPESLPGTAATFGTMFYLPSFIALSFPLEKRFKILLKSSGANVYMYWLAKLIWNTSIFATFTLLVGPVYYAFGYTGFDNIDIFIAAVCLFFCWSMAAVALTYLMSFVPFVVKNIRQTIFYVWMANFILGPIPWTLLLNLTEEFYDEQESKPWLNHLNNFLLLLPGHALAVATHRLVIVSVYGSQCKSIQFRELCDYEESHPCCDVEEGHFQNFGRFGILRIELCLLAEAVYFFVLIFVMETAMFKTFVNKLANYKLRWRERRLAKIHPALSALAENDDSLDLSAYQGQNAKSVGFEVLLNNLTQQSGNRTVVDRLTLGVLKYQTFGFIGSEGSGQSRIIRLIAGFSNPTSGDITIEDRSLVANYSRYISEISCCPKNHMLLLELTGRETLMLVGTVKRVSSARLKELIQNLAPRLGLEPVLDKLVLNYDLGSRRKLSFALSLIGKPRVLVLEEPFHEIDPDSREQMMNVLLQKRGHTTIILSSTNMELSVSFCDRIALLIDGKLACMGSPDFLMTNYSKGVTIIIQLVPEDCSFYAKKGIVYNYERPRDTEESGSYETESEDLFEGQGNLLKVQDQGLPVPVVINGSENRNRTSDEAKLPQYKARKHGSSSSSRTSSSAASGSSHGNSGADDALWEQELDPIMEYMEDNFPSAVLFDKSTCYLHYHLQGDNLDLSDIFRKMEIARIGFELEAYRVGTGTLTQLLGSYTRGRARTKEEE